MIYHLFVRPRPYLPPRVLFHHAVTTSYTSLLETDYNLHKSNSTYFADLDVSRTHLVSHLFRPGLKALAENETTRLVLDPRTNAPVRGRLGVMLGAVHASFKREIKPYESFQMWSRVLAWDRKWLYIATHFVCPTEPTSWDWRDAGRRLWLGGVAPPRTPLVEGDLRRPEQAAEWQRRVFATCVSKYVFKLGRLTVHPALIIQKSGFLPEGRPGGWTGGAQGTGVIPLETNGTFIDLGEEEWGWQQIEKMRLEGMRFAEHFAEMDKMHDTWDAGEDGALGHFAIG